MIMTYLTSQADPAQPKQTNDPGRVDGPVLQGKKTLDQALVQGPRPEETYNTAEEYDAVLRSHCRF